MSKSEGPRALWTVELPRDAEPRIRDGGERLVVVSSRKDVVLDARTGETLQLLAGRRDRGEALVLGDVLVEGPHGLERARSVLTGETRWENRRRTNDHARAWAKDLMVRFAARNFLEAFRGDFTKEAPGEPAWRYPAEGELEDGLAGGTDLLVLDDAIVLSGNEELVVLEKKTGAERWRGRAETVAADARGLVGCGGGELAAYDAKGRRLWAVGGGSSERVSSLYGLLGDSVAVDEGAELVLRDRASGAKIAALAPRPRRLHVVGRGAVVALVNDAREDALVAWSSRGEELFRITTPGWSVRSLLPLARGCALMAESDGDAKPLLVRLDAKPGSGVLELPGRNFLGPAWPGEDGADKRRKKPPSFHYFAADEWKALEPLLAREELPFELERSRNFEGRPSFTVSTDGRVEERFRELWREAEERVRALRLAKRPKNPVFVVHFDAKERGERGARIDGSCLVGAASRAEAKKTALAWLNANTLKTVGHEGVVCRWRGTETVATYEEEMKLTLEPHTFPKPGKVKVLDVGS